MNPNELQDRVALALSVGSLGYVLALVAAHRVNAVDVPQAPHAVQVPQGRVSGVFMQEVPAIVELFAVQFCNELNVETSSRVGAVHIGWVAALRVVQPLPRGKRCTHG